LLANGHPVLLCSAPLKLGFKLGQKHAPHGLALVRWIYIQEQQFGWDVRLWLGLDQVTQEERDQLQTTWSQQCTGGGRNNAWSDGVLEAGHVRRSQTKANRLTVSSDRLQGDGRGLAKSCSKQGPHEPNAELSKQGSWQERDSHARRDRDVGLRHRHQPWPRWARHDPV
jgi:hypothetical protein